MSKDLTHNQMRFADEYIISGNATEAYKKAYKNVKKDSAARANASRLLTNANVADYIQERNKSIQSDKIADMEEVREFWTNTLRDDENDYKDRLKASEFIAKTNGAFIDRQDINNTGDIGIKVEWVE